VDFEVNVLVVVVVVVVVFVSRSCLFLDAGIVQWRRSRRRRLFLDVYNWEGFGMWITEQVSE
jgi:hypothetical protein